MKKLHLLVFLPGCMPAPAKEVSCNLTIAAQHVNITDLLTKSLSATALWDSGYGVGAGITVSF